MAIETVTERRLTCDACRKVIGVSTEIPELPVNWQWVATSKRVMPTSQPNPGGSRGESDFDLNAELACSVTCAQALVNPPQPASPG